VKLKEIFTALYGRFKNDEVTALGAQVTYYFILSFFPFLMLLVTLVKYVPAAGRESLEELYRILPADAYNVVNEVIKDVFSSEVYGILSLSMIIILWASSSGTAALIKGINRAYDCKDTRAAWKVRVMAFLYTIIIAGIIVLTFVLLVLGELIGRYAFDYLGASRYFVSVWEVMRFGIAVLALIFVFFLLYLHMPCKRLKVREVIPGSVFSTTAWIIISLGFSYYVNNFGAYSLVYGSVGGVIVLLIWLYLSSIIMILGGEINAVIAYDV
jgi:membrane protein